jgi:hypothetical protein
VDTKPHEEVGTPTTPVRAVTSFTLADTTVAPSEEITFKFPARVASAASDRSWVSISDANSANTSYITWAFVTDKAGRATLNVPSKPGTYEARLYTHYPTQSYNIAHRVAFTVAAPAEAPDTGRTTVERFSLAATSVAPGAPVRITFPGPMIPKKGERYWITLVKVGTPDSSYGTWEYLVDKARAAKLTAPTDAGAYEVRLHANYPTKTSNVVFRRPLTIQ